MTVPASVANPVSVPSEAAGFHGDFRCGRPEALAFLPRHPSREDDWEARIEEARRVSPPAPVWEKAGTVAARLGADDVARGGISALAEGRALCIATGQQPGLFLGPLYTAYKALTAVALARRVARATDETVVPVFWLAADDSDFGEVGSAFLAGGDYRLTRYSLDGGELPAGGMVGNLATDGTTRALEEARTAWGDHPAAARVERLLVESLKSAGDHGELVTALLYGLFAKTGLVVVDGRWPELRAAAAPLFTAYAGRRKEIGSAVVEAGRALVAGSYRAPISEASTRNALFEVRDGRRLPFSGAHEELRERAADSPESLSPNVLLRPVVQDALFPNVATIGGPGEISYHAQLVPVYEALGVSMPVLFPRFEATLVPEGVRRLASRRECPLVDLVRDFDGALKRTANAALPTELRDALEDLEARVTRDAVVLRNEAGTLDPKLTNAVEEAEKRIGEALAKLREKLAAAVRSAETKHDPAIKSYREFLRPRGKPQERVLSSLTLWLVSASHPLGLLGEALEEHLVATRECCPVHWLLDLGPRGEVPS